MCENMYCAKISMFTVHSVTLYSKGTKPQRGGGHLGTELIPIEKRPSGPEAVNAKI